MLYDLETKRKLKRWIDLIGLPVYHKAFKTCKLVGIRTECESVTQIQLFVKTENGYFWTYDYETYIEPLKSI